MNPWPYRCPAVDVVSQPRVGWRFVVPYVVATVAMWMSFNAPAQVLIGQQLIALDEANKERNLAIVLGVGAVISLVANPLFGMLSDRSRSSRGRRRPFLLGGAIGACLGLAVLAVAPNVAVLLLGWCLVQGSLNCYLAAIIAIIPDRVPASQRATDQRAGRSVAGHRHRGRRRPDQRHADDRGQVRAAGRRARPRHAGSLPELPRPATGPVTDRRGRPSPSSSGRSRTVTSRWPGSPVVW